MSEALPRLPFENRWTSGERARHWYQQLEREGVSNVRLRHALRDVELDREDEEPIPNEFVMAWLDYHAREHDREVHRWRWAILMIVFVAAIAATVAAWYSVRAYYQGGMDHSQFGPTKQVESIHRR